MKAAFVRCARSRSDAGCRQPSRILAFGAPSQDALLKRELPLGISLTVIGDVAGEEKSRVYAIINLSKQLDTLRGPGGYSIERYATHLPFMTDQLSMKWDGKWHITYDAFRDLGVAFGVVLMLIYLIVVAWFQSFRIPLVIMAPIPLTLVGILPGRALMGAYGPSSARPSARSR